MKPVTRKYALMFGLAVGGWLGNGEIGPAPQGGLVATAEAVVGRPATPVSYAGVARRSTVGPARPAWVLRRESGWARPVSASPPGRRRRSRRPRFGCRGAARCGCRAGRGGL